MGVSCCNCLIITRADRGGGTAVDLQLAPLTVFQATVTEESVLVPTARVGTAEIGCAEASPESGLEPVEPFAITA